MPANSSNNGHPFIELASESVLTQLQDFESSIEAMYDLPPPPTTTTASTGAGEGSGTGASTGAGVLSSPSSPQTFFHHHHHHERTIIRVTWDNVSIDGVLGEGGFSFIFRARHIQQQQQQQDESISTLSSNKNGNDDNGANDDDGELYALKCLKAKTIKTEQDLAYNAMDLFTESFLLSRLNHPNIIGLHGVSDCTLADSFLKSDGYFVLLDIIHSTLFDELENWRSNLSKSSIKSARTKVGIVERLQEVMLPVVEAMEYIHDQQIVLRDLKPENIGFDKTGRVKLFDFGLARNVNTVEEGDVAGSICYMAPEIMLQIGTYLASDVYSFAIILWEVCVLQIPLVDFADFDSVKKRVANGGWRPACSRIPSKAIRTLIKQCWDHDPISRPTFTEIEERLYKTIDKHDGVAVEEEGYSFSSSTNEKTRMKRRMSGHSLISASSRHSVMSANF